MSKFWQDTMMMFRRSITRTLRNPAWVMIGLFQPILYLLLFAPLLDGVRMPWEKDTLTAFVPGLLVLMALFGAAFSGFGVLDDLKSGVIERLRVTPANRLALLLGMILPEVLVFLTQCLLLVVFATVFGLRASLPGIMILFGLLALIGVMMISFSYALALLVKDQSGLAAILNTLMQPIMLLSGVLLPLSLAPAFMQTIAKANPFSHAVDASRALMAGDLTAPPVGIAFVMIVGAAGFMLLWAVNVFKKANA